MSMLQVQLKIVSRALVDEDNITQRVVVVEFRDGRLGCVHARATLFTICEQQQPLCKRGSMAEPSIIVYLSN